MQEKRQKKNIGEIIDKKYFTKEELQTHDRELVKEVCEKIRKRARIECGSIYSLLSELANEIQKEYEK